MARPSRLLQGVPWVLIGNAGYMLSMAALTFVLPKYLAPLEFGYWQLFQFYALYLGYLTLGYSDGVLLRLAGRPKSKFPGREITSGLVFLALIEFFLFASIAVVGIFVIPDMGGQILALACIGTFFYIPRVCLTFIFQAAGESRMVAISTLIERFVLLAGFLIYTMNTDLGLVFLLFSDVLGKVIGLGVALGLAGPLVRDFGLEWRAGWRTFVADCRRGLFVVLSNLSAISLNGAVRLIIGAAFGTVLFGQLSFALQVSTVLLVVINAVAIAVFPNLKRLGSAFYAESYRVLDRGLSTPALFSLLFCYPVVKILEWWLPEYRDAVMLLALLFPIGFLEVKGRGVLSVLMKAMDREKQLFAVNLGATVLGAFLCWIGAYLMDSFVIASLALVVALYARTAVLEILVCSAINEARWRRSLTELAIIALFYGAALNSFAPVPHSMFIAATVMYALVWFIGGRRRSRSTYYSQLEATAPASPDIG